MILGSSLGEESAIDLSNADYIYQEYSNNGSGSSVSSAGDVNGDGLDDIIIGTTGRSYLILSDL